MTLRAGLMAGAMLCTIPEACDSPDREHGPSVRFLPRTCRELWLFLKDGVVESIPDDDREE